MLLLLCLLPLVAVVVCQRNELVDIYEDFSGHPCNRKCNGTKMTCNYKLTLDRYFTMQPDCLGCSRSNQTDCDNPQCIPADGVPRQALVFNGRLPGPTITVCQGDTVHANVENLADPESTSIHWHGMHMRGNSWNDGVPMITQCPIAAYTTWRYKFIATQAGTHYYHSHSGVQRSDGAYGALIVKDTSVPNHLYKYDYDLSEHVISFLDWMSYMSTDNHLRYLRTKVLFYDRISAILVNGYGPSATNNAPIKSFTVRKGKSYRFRIIHACSLVCPIEISIDNHKLIVINSDGNYIKPEEVNILTMRNGERYDFILHANQPVSSYGIRINGSLTCNSQSLAMLKYEGSEVTTIEFSSAPPRQGLIMNCLNADKTAECINYDQISSITPIEPELRNVDLKYYIVFDHYNVVPRRYAGVSASEELIVPFINQISNEPRSTPLILDHAEHEWCNYQNKPNCNRTGFCQCTHVVPIEKNYVVELIFVDEGKLLQLSHPFHQHGYSMRVIGHEKLGRPITGSQVRDLDNQGKLIRNLTNPIIKDTIAIPSGGYTIVRFKADNPGFWALHCHVEYHSEEGMLMVLAVKPYPRVPHALPRCGNFPGYMG